ncbi:Phospholipase B-like 1 [Lamellibrachia satsuma]|nr:Phospholipase B-like 1 [Lamellibrachia satsuma]
MIRSSFFSIIILYELAVVVYGDHSDHSAGEYAQGSVYMKNGVAHYVAGQMDKKYAAAYGRYNNTLMETGWGLLEIKAGYGALTKNQDLMYAAGFLEGIFTARQIYQNYVNVKPLVIPKLKKSLEGKLRQYFQKQDEWLRAMILKYTSSDPYWQHVAYVMSQFDGLYNGYKLVAEKSWPSDVFVIQLLNGVGDVIDLAKALDPDSWPDYAHMTYSQLLQSVHRRGHCSALVKVTGAYEDMFLSHSSWFEYAATMRIFKHYHLNVVDKHTSAREISFSSYPGFLESLDDFYLMDSSLVLLQTTNNVFNYSLYKLVQSSSMLAWQRVRVANMMASSGSEWSQVFAKYNSGTYNNQYMVVDLKKVHLGRTIDDNALWVVEQIPGLVVGADQTPTLRTGYWPSYNVPFYEEVYNRSGYPGVVKEHGTDFSYQLAPRAKIFRRDQAKVVNMADMKAIMRYNDYKTDPYSEGKPCNTICCRGDLAEHPGPFGCYDTKVSDYKMALLRQAFIINGPTLGTGLKPFSWTGPFKNMSHVGLPTTYDFDWVGTRPLL